jgi:hypothetical protein
MSSAGFLGALAGFGQGLATVGANAAQDIRAQRIAEMKEQLDMARETRGVQRDIDKEVRDRAWQLNTEQRKEKIDINKEIRTLKTWFAQSAHTDAQKRAFAKFEADIKRTSEGMTPTTDYKNFVTMLSMGVPTEYAFGATFGTTHRTDDPLGQGQVFVTADFQHILGRSQVIRDDANNAVDIQFQGQPLPFDIRLTPEMQRFANVPNAGGGGGGGGGAAPPRAPWPEGATGTFEGRRVIVRNGELVPLD